MNASDRILDRPTVIVLNERNRVTNGFVEILLVKALIKKTSLIIEYIGLDEFYIWNLSFNDFHEISLRA